jgi:hypothetical protein
MKSRSLLLVALAVLWLAPAIAFAQPPFIVGGGSNSEVLVMVNGNVYMRVSRTGAITLENGATLTIPSGSSTIPFTGVNGGTATRIPFFDSGGALSSDAGLVFTSSTGRLDVTGQAAQTGTVRSTLNYAGDGNIRAVMIARRDSRTLGTATAGDGVEYLIQQPDTSGNYANVGGFICRILDPTPSVLTGRCEIAVKGTGAFNSSFDLTRMVFDTQGNVGIGYYFGNSTLSAAPAAILHVARDATDPAGASTSIIDERASADTGAAAFVFRKNRGSLATKLHVNSGDSLGQVLWQGYQETTSNVVSSASIQVTAQEDFTSTAGGSIMNFNVTPTGTAAQATRMIVTNAGVTMAGAAPTVANVGANSCGTTTATVDATSTQNSGRITVGATSGTQCRLTVPAATNAWDGSCTDRTTAVLCRLVGVSTTTFDLLGSFTAGDSVSFTAFPR